MFWKLKVTKLMHLMRLLFIFGAFIKYSAMPPGEWTMTVEGREISQKGDKISARIMASVHVHICQKEFPEDLII